MLGVALGDDAGPGIRRDVAVLGDLGAADGHGPLAVAIRADPAHRARVATAIERLELVDQGKRDVGRGAGDGGRGVQSRDEVEARGAVGELALDIAREVPQVRQLQSEGALRGRQRAHVRLEGLHDTRQGEVMLVEVLGRGGESGGLVVIGHGVATAGLGSGEHPGTDGAVVDSHESLGARADQAVDGIRPAVGVAEREIREHAAQVAALGQVPDEVAGEHDLLQLAGLDEGDGRLDGGAVGIGLDRARQQRDAKLRAERPGGGQAGRAGGQTGGAGGHGGCSILRGTGRILDDDAREPGDPAAPADDQLRNDQGAHERRPLGEGKRSEGHEARSRGRQRVGDLGGGGYPEPRRTGVGDAVRALELEAERGADAGETVALAHPEQRTPRVDQGEQKADVVHSRGLDAKAGYGLR